MCVGLVDDVHDEIECANGLQEGRWITGKSLIRALAKVDFPDPGGPTRRRTLWTAVFEDIGGRDRGWRKENLIQRFRIESFALSRE